MPLMLVAVPGYPCPGYQSCPRAYRARHPCHAGPASVFRGGIPSIHRAPALAPSSLPAEDWIDSLDQDLHDVLDLHKLKGGAFVFILPEYDQPITRVSGVKDCAGDAPDLETAWMLASVSKTYTGLAAAIALETGADDGSPLIDDIDGNVEDLVNYTVRHPVFRGSKITLRQLLTHQSALERSAPILDSGALPSYGPDTFCIDENQAVCGTNPTCPLDGLALWYRDLLDGGNGSGFGGTQVTSWLGLAMEGDGSWIKDKAPGSKPVYSNIGAGFVGAVIEHALQAKAPASGLTTFAQFCERYIFSKLGLKNTAWFQNDLQNKRNVADHYNNAGSASSQDGPFQCTEPYCYVDYPSGQLRTS
eukprot:gene8147-1455_t